MKECVVISGFYVDQTVDGETQKVPKYPGDTVELSDAVADEYYGKGWVDITSHDSHPVGYGACCVH